MMYAYSGHPHFVCIHILRVSTVNRPTQKNNKGVNLIIINEDACEPMRVSCDRRQRRKMAQFAGFGTHMAVALTFGYSFCLISVPQSISIIPRKPIQEIIVMHLCTNRL